MDEDTFPDIGSMSDEELKELIDELTEEEQRGLLPAADPARQDRHPAGRAGQPPARSSARRATATITGADVEQLTEILAGKVAPPEEA